MILAILIVGGVLVGALIRRWWALTAALGVGIWAAAVEEVEVAGWILGLICGIASGLGIAVGIAVGRLARSGHESRRQR